MDPAEVIRLVARGRGLDPESAEARALAEAFASEPGRVALARIACGYDGGQV